MTLGDTRQWFSNVLNILMHFHLRFDAFHFTTYDFAADFLWGATQVPDLLRGQFVDGYLYRKACQYFFLFIREQAELLRESGLVSLFASKSLLV